VITLQSVLKQKISSPWLRKSYHPYWFSRSAWSLVAIVRWYQLVTDVATPRVWVPDYFCNQSLGGIREAGVHLVFYSITEDMAPDWEHCSRLASEATPHLFLLPHYFGKANQLAETKQFCKKHKALLIEDCAHAFMPNGLIGSTGDFVLYSPHKTLKLPDGALLLANPSVMKTLKRNPEDFSTTFDEALTQLPEHIFKVNNWLIKSIARKFVPHIVMKVIKKHRVRKVIQEPVGLIFPPGQSRLSERLIHRSLSRLEAYGWHRYHHAVILQQAFLKHDSTEAVTLIDDTCFPYMIGINIKKKNLERLSTKHFSGLCWPDLAPEVLNKPIEHAVAIDLEKRSVFFPVHHALNISKVLRSFKLKALNIVLDEEVVAFELVWDIAVEEWHELFAQASKTHAQQSYAYAKAFQKDKGWQPRFAKLKLKNKVVAIFVVLEKKGPMGCAIARLNRGPIWLDSALNEKRKIKALTSISRYYRLRKGKVLFCAPNLLMNSHVICGLYDSGFHRRFLRPWVSIDLDLKVEPDVLRASLDGKWRNQLSLAERKGLKVEVSEDILAFDWLVEQHAMMMNEKGFVGPTVNFLRCLWDASKSSCQPFLIFRAFCGEQCVGGIAVVGHGRSATYLIGYNSDEGRRLNANNFLLWNAVLVLKEKDYTCFDLGGINEYETPGITSFKRGLRGNEYRLVGEYVMRKFK